MTYALLSEGLRSDVYDFELVSPDRVKRFSARNLVIVVIDRFTFQYLYQFWFASIFVTHLS